MPSILTLSAVPKTMDQAKEVLEKVRLGELIPHPDFSEKVVGLLEYVASGRAQEESSKENASNFLLDLELSKAASLVRETIEYLTRKESELLALALPCSHARNILNAKQEMYQILVQIENPLKEIPF